MSSIAQAELEWVQPDQRGLLKAELKRADIGRYEELAKRLTEMGLPETTHRRLPNKLSRGSFSGNLSACCAGHRNR